MLSGEVRRADSGATLANLASPRVDAILEDVTPKRISFVRPAPAAHPDAVTLFEQAREFSVGSRPAALMSRWRIDPDQAYAHVPFRESNPDRFPVEHFDDSSLLNQDGPRRY